MGLLKKKKKKSRKKPVRLREWSVLRCPLNGHQVGPCRQLCTPNEGLGQCGRDAPHGLVGRTQAAIRAYNSRLERSGEDK